MEYLRKVIFVLISGTIGFIVRSFEEKKYLSIYMIIIFISSPIIGTNQKNILPLMLEILIGVIVLTIIIFSIYQLRNFNEDIAGYYERRMKLWLSIWITSAIFLLNIYKPLFPYFYLGSFIALQYYASRYFVEKYLDKWFKYALFFLLVPLLAFLFTGLNLTIIFELISIEQPYLKVTDESIYKFSLFTSIIIQNLVTFFTRRGRLVEVKVATYFILAFSSTLSYCFFASDIILSSFPQEMVGYLGGEDVVKNKIQLYLNWFLFPYLVGTVWACFIVEYKERQNSNHKIDRDIY
ncbi:hypothetical protein [Cytobacillus firmus]|uniref:hypothetical protein n=1 Tax=Cytobacillus firmus TaxID=1399 RepID=UPI0024C16E14|nr:hypothetical protein [Cytobacillus firmus]WHY63245.1 hypothetical protein QNH42_07770 [Cytobacillus firmus]